MQTYIHAHTHGTYIHYYVCLLGNLTDMFTLVQISIIRGDNNNLYDAGFPGQRGERGTPGSTGFPGARGIQGAAGERGDSGLNGGDGRRGYPGPPVNHNIINTRSLLNLA